MRRIGHLLPSTSLGAERWVAQICAPLSVEAVHPTARATLPEQLCGPAIAGAQAVELERGAAQLAQAGADVVVWNGGSCGLHGLAHARAVVRTIEATAGVPASTVTLGQLDLLARHALPSLALVTAGSRESAGRVADTYVAAGLRVTSVTALGLGTPREAAELPVARLRRLLLDARHRRRAVSGGGGHGAAGGAGGGARGAGARQAGVRRGAGRGAHGHGAPRPACQLPCLGRAVRLRRPRGSVL
ncbi:hypothetical protein ACH4D5_29850 [Streptomyces sp. NPDC018029]|uniref:hypothetical protein n=1 Tax=Streptomyces sp. NPDC018029 TaxID=3365032 RepID=UPI0037959939